MKYSQDQLDKLRTALWSYYQHGKDTEGKRYNWMDVREAILLDTGVAVGADTRGEALRQFVVGLKDKDNPQVKKYRELQDDWLDAVKQFVTDRYNELLSQDDLRTGKAENEAALRLLEYLGASESSRVRRMKQEIKGAFQSRGKILGKFVVRDLVLRTLTETGLIEVFETEYSYPAEAESTFRAWTVKECKEACESEGRYLGWAVRTPEMQMLFFLKDEHNRKNRYYVTLGADHPFMKGYSPIVMALMQLPKEPVSLSRRDNIVQHQQEVMGSVGSNIVHFSPKFEISRKDD